MRLPLFVSLLASRRHAVVAVAATLSSFSPALRAQWIGATSGSGTAQHGYNATANWNGGTINDSFAGVTATNVTYFFDADRTTGAGGLDLTFASIGLVNFESDGAAARTLTLGGNLTTSGAGLGQFTLGSTVAARGLNLNLGGATRTFTVGDDFLYVANTISNGGIVKAGSGALVLLGTNTFTGDLVINAGHVEIGPTTGSVVGNIVNNSSGLGLVLHHSGALSATSVISGTGPLLLQSYNQTFFVPQTYTGITTVANGELRGGANNVFAPSSQYTLSSGTLDLNGTTQTIGGLTGASASSSVTNTAASPGALTLNQSDATVFLGRLLKGTGGLAFTKSGTGTFSLTGPRTHDVGTITVNGGVFVLSNASGVLSSTNVTVNNPIADTTVDFSINAGTFSGSMEFDSSGPTAQSTGAFSNGAQITTSALTLGKSANSFGSIALSGATSRWTNTGALVVGDGGFGAFTISTGATFTGTNATFGNQAGSSSTVILSGAGTALTLSGSLTAGGSGSPIVTVSNGAVLSTGSATVRGSLAVQNAQWINSGSVVVGSSAAGTVALSSGATATTGAVTVGAGASGTLSVTGAGTSLATTGNVTIGSAAAGSLGVSTGATLTVGTGGSGSLLIASAVGVTGNLFIGGGTAPGTLNAASVALGAGTGALAFNHTDTSGTYIFAPAITGTSGAITFTGSSVTRLTGASTFTGTTTIGVAARVYIGNGGTTGSFAGNVTNNAQLHFNRSDDIIYAGIITGGGTTYQDGPGMLTLSGASTFSDGLYVTGGTARITGDITSNGDATNVQAGGTLRIGAGGTAGSHTGLIKNFSAVIFDRSDSLTHAGQILNTGTVTQAGTGTLTLTAAHTYTGATTVSAGTLRINGSIAAGSTVTVASGATLGGTGTINGSVVASAGGRTAPGASIGTLTIGGSYTWNGSTDGSATQIFELSNSNSTCDLLAIAGAFTKGTGSTFKFDFSNSGTLGTTYTLATFGSTTFAAGDFTATNLPSGLAASFALVGGTQLQLTLISANAAPVVTTSGGATAFTENGTALAIDPGLTVTDSDNATLASGSVSITGNFQTAEDALAFTSGGAFGNISGSYNSGTGVLTLNSAGATATLAQWQAALRSVAYVNSSDNPNTTARTISFAVNDGTSSSTAATKSVSVAAVNDAPGVTAPASIAGTEDTLLALTGITFADADAGASSVTVTFSVPGGSLSAGLSPGITIGGTATARTLTGTLAALNAFIAASNLGYTPAADVNGNLTLAISIDDGGNTGSGGAKTGTASVTLALAAVNDAPGSTMPVVINLNEDAATALTGISFTDPDANGGTMTATFTVTRGTWSGESSGGVTAAQGATTRIRTLSGTLANLNAYIAASQLIYTPDQDYSGVDPLTLRINDNGNTGSGGALFTDNLTPLFVAAINDPPVNSLPSSQSTLQNTPLTITGASKISIADVDAGGASVQVALTATNGTFSLSGTAGLAFTAGDGTADAATTFTGTIAAINTALDGLVFTPTAAFVGNATLQIVTNDLGNTGGGGLGSIGTDTDTLTIAVGGVPVIVTSAGATAWTEPDPVATVAVAIDAALTVTDSNSATLPSGTVSITAGLVAAEDTLAFNNNNAATFGNIAASYASGTGILSLTSAGNTATLAQWQAALRAVTYSNSSATPTTAARTITFTVTDGTNTSAAATKSVTITAVNNAPINAFPSTVSTPQNVAYTFTGANKISVADADVGAASIQVRFTITNGVIRLGSGPSGTPLTITASLANLNTALDNATFTPAAGFVGTATILIETTDQGNTGPDGIKTDTDTITITVTAPPPPPPTVIGQVVTFAPASVQIGQSVTLSATASSGLPVTFAIVSGGGTLDGAVFTPASLAPVVIRASQAGNATYTSAFADQTITPTGKLPQTIAFAPLADRPANAPPFALAATASSNLGLTYTIVSGPALLSGNTITLTGAPGTVVVTASQTGDTNFNPAASVTRSFNVTPIDVIVLFGTTNSGDDVAATLKLDRTSGRAIGYLRATGEAFVLPFTPNAGAAGTYAGIGKLFSATTPSRDFRATLRTNDTGDTLTGSVEGDPLTFSIRIQPQIGPSAAVAGGYHAPLLNTAAGETHAVVSAPGRVYYVAATPGLTGGGFGTLDASHTFSVTTTPTATVAGAIDPATTIVTGIYTRPGSSAAAFSGLNIATLRTDRLVNLSSRGRVSTGNRALIAGFVIAGDGLKNVLIRATGPALRPFGIASTLTDPRIFLYRDGRVVHDNDDWQQSPNPADISAGGVRVGAFPLAAGSKDAAIVDSLAPGAYTAVVSDDTSIGVALAEIYDAALNPSSEYQRLVNISSRGESSPGEGVLVGGFIVSGNFPKRVLIRGVGPALGTFGVANTLTDPGLKVYNQIGVLLAQNDNWETPAPASSIQTAATAAEITAATARCGAFALPAGGKDASIILTLAPGSYTAHVGATSQTGIALVEIYEIPE